MIRKLRKLYNKIFARNYEGVACETCHTRVKYCDYCGRKMHVQPIHLTLSRVDMYNGKIVSEKIRSYHVCSTECSTELVSKVSKKMLKVR